MAYYLKVEGMAEVSEMLSRLEEAAPAIAAEAVYEGAAVVRDAISLKMASFITAAPSYSASAATAGAASSSLLSISLISAMPSTFR